MLNILKPISVVASGNRVYYFLTDDMFSDKALYPILSSSTQSCPAFSGIKEHSNNSN